MDADSVTYRLERTGRTAHEERERLLTTSCPACGADWRTRGAATPRREGTRTYRCTACGEHHRAVQVGEHGEPVETPGSWGVTQQHRLRRVHDDAKGPDRLVRGGRGLRSEWSALPD